MKEEPGRRKSGQMVEHFRIRVSGGWGNEGGMRMREEWGREKVGHQVVESRRLSWIQNSKILIGRRESFDPSCAAHNNASQPLQNICHISNANDFLRFWNRFDDYRYSCSAPILTKQKSSGKPLKDAGATVSPASSWGWWWLFDSESKL